MGDEMSERLAMFQARVQEQDRERPGYAADWQRLAEAILRHGGIAVVPPLESELLAKVLADCGTIQQARTVTLEEGEPISRHQNAARLWRDGQADAIGTGYALSDDGLWRSHSWAVRGDALVETTAERAAYWGVVVRDEGAEAFAAMV